MANRPTKSTGVTGAILAGVLLVPASAIAAVAIVGATTRPPAAEAASDTTTTTIVEESTSTSALDTTTTSFDAGDEQASMDEACTAGAEALLDKETDGSLSTVEAAALDALREICDDNGFAVAGPRAEEVIRVVRQVAPATTTTMDDSPSESSHGEDSYDEDHEDEDHEDEDHEDEDHEDEHREGHEDDD